MPVQWGRAERECGGGWYQGTVVFVVLAGQVGDGGGDAGAQQHFPLVQVTLVDLIQQLMVSGQGKVDFNLYLYCIVIVL